MKKFLVLIICLSALIYSTLNSKKISDYISNTISNNQKLIINETNAYTKKESYMFVKYTTDFVPYSYNDLLNIIYSVIDNGWDTFTFYCPTEYTNCINDMESINSNNLLLTHINNFVHPYNSFTKINTQMYESGEITLTITKVYTQTQIEAIETEINRLMNLLIDKNKSDYNNIKNIHDYIINHTKYDESQNNGQSKYASSIAYGTLFDHFATCNGYTDAMAIFLNKMNIKNYKVATTSEDLKDDSAGHIWNAVYLDGKWKHLDLTWDDPVSEEGKDYLYHKYFLISTQEMNKVDSGNVQIDEHNFNKSIYLEFNESIKLPTS